MFGPTMELGVDLLGLENLEFAPVALVAKRRRNKDVMELRLWEALHKAR